MSSRIEFSILMILLFIVSVVFRNAEASEESTGKPGNKNKPPSKKDVLKGVMDELISAYPKNSEVEEMRRKGTGNKNGGESDTTTMWTCLSFRKKSEGATDREDGDKTQKNYPAEGGGKSIPISQLNDNFCDCPDGSDEPGTAACSFVLRHKNEKDPWKFQCADGFPKVQRIFHSQVNDGICDCCDGSDESDAASVAERVFCKNTCNEEREKHEAARQAGIRARSVMLIAAANKKEEMKKQLVDHQKVLETIDQEISVLATELEIEQKKEDEEKRRIYDRSLQEKKAWDEEKKKKKEERKQNNDDNNGTNREEDGPPDPLQCVKWRQTRNCKGTSVGDPAHDKDCTAILTTGNSGVCDCIDPKTKQEHTFPFDCGHRNLKCQKICAYRGKDGGFEPDPTNTAVKRGQDPDEFPNFDDGSGFKLPSASTARAKHDSALQRRHGSTEGVKTIQQDLQRDYGPEDIFLALLKECFPLTVGREFSYDLCVFNEAKQRPLRGGGRSYILGRYKGFAERTYGDWGGGQDYTKMLFEQGEQCHKEPRSAEVSFVCGGLNKLIAVEERQMCKYTFVFETPAVCE